MDLTVNSSTYIGDVSPYLPRGGVAGIAQSGSVTDAFIQSGSRVGFTRIISCGTEVVLDVCDYLAYCLDDPETTSVILFVEGFKRPERFLALADRALELGKPIMAVKVGRSDQAQASAVAHSGSLAGEARVTDAALDAAGVIRCADLDELLETAELVEGMRRTGRSVGRGRTGVVTVSTGEASLIADLVPRTGLDLPPLPETARARILEHLPTMGYVGNPMDPWGAADPATAYGAVFESMAASGAYDVLVLVHDFPYKSMPAEVATANDVTTQLLAATRDRPHILPVYVSLTSGEPPPETKALLDEQGDGAPLLRGALEAFSAIAAVARWERARARRLEVGPWRTAWPALAADRTAYGLGPVATNGVAGRPARRARPERHIAAGAVRAREPGPPARRRPAGDGGAGGAGRGRGGRGGPRARGRPGRHQDRRHRPAAQERPRTGPAGPRRATTDVRAAAGDLLAAARAPRPRRPRPGRGADGCARGGADRRAAPRPVLRSGRRRRARGPADGGPRRRRDPPGAGRSRDRARDARRASRGTDPRWACAAARRSIAEPWRT